MVYGKFMDDPMAQVGAGSILIMKKETIREAMKQAAKDQSPFSQVASLRYWTDNGDMPTKSSTTPE